MRLLTLLLLVTLLTIPLSSQEIQSVWDLASLHPDKYDVLFHNNTVDPKVSDFRGQKFNGFILHVANKELGAIVYKLYTGNPLDFLSNGLTLQALTFQKRFYPQDNKKGESGINFWPVKGEESLPMRIYISPCLSDAQANSLKIDYDVESNDPITQRVLIDEVRQIPYTQLYLGKMYYRICGEPYFFLWFVLEKR
jgi:hypothetical protein